MCAAEKRSHHRTPYVILNNIELVGVFVENGLRINIEELNERIAMNVGLEESHTSLLPSRTEKTYTGVQAFMRL